MPYPLLQPVLALMLLTLLVWAYMYVRRFAYIIPNRIEAQSVATPELINSVLPANVNWPSNNLKNLFELPVLFYAVCALLIVTQRTDALYVDLAWAYAALRAVHSLIQCTINIVLARFAAYALSSLVLWVMVVRLSLSAF